MKCPYNPKIICDFLVQAQDKPTIKHECSDCEHNTLDILPPPDADFEARSLGKLLFVSACIACAMIMITIVITIIKSLT